MTAVTFDLSSWRTEAGNQVYLPNFPTVVEAVFLVHPSEGMSLVHGHRHGFSALSMQICPRLLSERRAMKSNKLKSHTLCCTLESHQLPPHPLYPHHPLPMRLCMLSIVGDLVVASVTVCLSWWTQRQEIKCVSLTFQLWWFVCWLLNVPATCECISGTDLQRQFYVLPH